MEASVEILGALSLKEDFTLLAAEIKPTTDQQLSEDMQSAAWGQLLA